MHCSFVMPRRYAYGDTHLWGRRPSVGLRSLGTALLAPNGGFAGAGRCWGKGLVRHLGASRNYV